MEKILQKPVSSLMTKKVITVKKDEPLKNLIKLLSKKGILGVPVVDSKKRVVGIVTESDLIRHFTSLKSPRATVLMGSVIFADIQTFNKELKDHAAETVEDLMTSPAITLPQTATLLKAIELMSKKHISRLPITGKGGKVTGLLTRTDVLGELAKIKRI